MVTVQKILRRMVWAIWKIHHWFSARPRNNDRPYLQFKYNYCKLYLPEFDERCSGLDLDDKKIKPDTVLQWFYNRALQVPYVNRLLRDDICPVIIYYYYNEGVSSACPLSVTPLKTTVDTSTELAQIRVYPDSSGVISLCVET